MSDVFTFSFSHLGTGLIARYQCKGAKHIAPFHLDYYPHHATALGLLFLFHGLLSPPFLTDKWVRVSPGYPVKGRHECFREMTAWQDRLQKHSIKAQSGNDVGKPMRSQYIISVRIV